MKRDDRRLKIAAFLAILYVLLIPVVPFANHYSGNLSETSMDAVCPKSLVTFDFFSTPSSHVSSSFVVSGEESLTAVAFDFGLRVVYQCGFAPGTPYAETALSLLTVTCLVGLVILVRPFAKSKGGDEDDLSPSDLWREQN